MACKVNSMLPGATANLEYVVRIGKDFPDDSEDGFPVFLARL